MNVIINHQQENIRNNNNGYREEQRQKLSEWALSTKIDEGGQGAIYNCHRLTN